MYKKIIGGGLCLMMGIAGITGTMHTGKPINLIFSFIFFPLAAYFIFSKSKMKEKTHQGKVAYLSPLEIKKQELGYIESITSPHTVGLPLAEGVYCDIYYCPDRIVIESGGAIFNLPHEKISDIDTVTDTELQKQYVSSIGGAVGGAVLFGPLGAMIGGRAKQKTTAIISRYLVFTYEKDDKLEYISFDATSNIAKAYKFVGLFRSNSSKQKKEYNL